MENLVERRSVSLYPSDWEIVDQSGARMGLSTSTSLRMIVRQWAQQFKTAMQRGSVTVDAAPADVDDAQA